MSQGAYWNGERYVKAEDFRRPAPAAAAVKKQPKPKPRTK